MSYLTPIDFLSNSDNLSGLKPLKLARAVDVATFPESYEFIAQEELVFESGKDWINWAATYRTSGFTTRAQDSEEGMNSTQELPFVIARHSADRTVMFKKAEKDEFIVLFEDMNGQRYLFGTKEKPVRFRFDMMTGSGGDRNQYSCAFYSDSPGNFLIYPQTFGEGETDFSSCPPVVVRRGATDGPVLAVAPAGSTLVIVSPFSLGYQISTL